MSITEYMSYWECLSDSYFKNSLHAGYTGDMRGTAPGMAGKRRALTLDGSMLPLT